MGGEFFLRIKKNNNIHQSDWSKVLCKMMYVLYQERREIFENEDGTEYNFSFQMTSTYAFQYEDSVASWSDGVPKSFRLKWQWGDDAVENNLGGRHRGDWSTVRLVCEFLCDHFPGQLALVVSNGFSGYNDDLGTIYYDGMGCKYKECPYDSWPQ